MADKCNKFYCILFYSQELRKTESTLRAERDQWRDQATANKHEVEKLRGKCTVISKL